MKKLDNILKNMDFEYFASGQHKESAASFLTRRDAVFLDLRSVQETETLSFNLIYHMPVLHIPLHELPNRLDELPADKLIGLFCSSGIRIAMAYVYLMANDFENVVMIPGGLESIVPELKPGKILKAARR